jgi:hypothetical protein
MINKDFNEAIYMLHYVDEELFSKKEVQAICFSIKVKHIGAKIKRIKVLYLFSSDYVALIRFFI